MKYLLLLVLAIWGEGIRAQEEDIGLAKIRGTLVSEEQRNPLANATVTLLYAKDSSAFKSTLSDKAGDFELNRIRPGEYQLYISYLGYQAVWRKTLITEKDTLVYMGAISMRGSGITLATVEIVNESPPMVIKRDTLEFNAGAFKTREYGVVEDLLKRLPGIVVERDGTIKVNGVAVRKLLVDGKPFFGDDPTVATRNLTADMIDKVQFIDRKSDWSQFTEINDGRREKTINLTIKKNMKNAYFGRVGGALATGDHFAVNSNLNKFNDQQQLAFFVAGTDINGYQDKGGQGAVAIGGNSSVRNWTGTGALNRDLSEKLKIGGAYSASNNYAEDKRSSKRKNLLPDTTWYYNKSSHSQVASFKHILSMHMELIPDTSHMLNVTARFNYVSSKSFQENMYTSMDGKQQLINSGVISNTGRAKNPNFSTTALFGKKFRKAGRTMTFNMGTEYSTNNTQSINMSRNLFVDPGGNNFMDTINQNSIVTGINGSISLSLTYTEPLIKHHYLELTYGYTYDNGTSERLTYDFNPSGKVYDRKNDSLSNSFSNKSSIQQAGVKILAQMAKYGYTVGLNTQYTNLDNENISQNIRIQQHAVNFFPSAGFNYFLNSGKQLQFSFSGNTQQPTTLQLQPVPDNSNPLYVQLGNPDLKPAFISAFNIGYSTTNPVTMRMFSININSDFFTNKIVDASWFDSLGRQVSQPLNIDGSFVVNTSVSANFPIKKQRTSINTNISLGFNRDVGYINGMKGDTRTCNIASNMNYHYSHKEVFSIGANVNAIYNMVRYTMQQEKANFLNYTFSFDSNIRLPLDVTIGGNMIYQLNTNRAAGYDKDAAMLNVFVSKFLFKRRQGLLRLQGVDLLNSNLGFTRTVGVNYIEDVQTTIMQRLFLLSFTYFVRSVKKP